MSSSHDSELIASMEDMEVKEDTAEFIKEQHSFNEGDLVFAKAIGYIPWPGIIVSKQGSQSMVNFLGSDDTRRIDNAKIWLYNESTKAQYITRKNLDYLEFRDAILIAEKLNCVDVNKENGSYCYRVLSKSDLEEEHEQEKESQEEALQGEASTSHKKSIEEKSGKQEPRKEEHAEKELGKGEPGKEDPGKEGLGSSGKEEPGEEEPGKEDNKAMKYLRILRNSHEYLNGDIEKKFIELVNLLRQSLKINQKDYPSALLALQELHDMPLSELLLVRNFEAMNSIYLICFLDTAHRNYDEANQVKLLARKLITRIASMLKLPDTLGEFMNDFRSLSVIYRRSTQEFEPLRRESSEEEYCQKFVAVEEDEQEDLAWEEDRIYWHYTPEFEPRQRESRKEEYCHEFVAVEDYLAVEEDGQEDLAVEEDGQDALAMEEDGQDAFAVEEDGQDAFAVEEDGQDALAMEEDGQDAMFSLDHYYPTLEIEERFDQLIKILRRSLSFRQKDYPSALSAFDELLSFEFTKDFLMPKYKAVYFIYYLARSGCVFPSNNLAKATLVRNLANQLMVRFFTVFNLPGITAYDFMVHFCSLYPEDLEFEYDSD